MTHDSVGLHSLLKVGHQVRVGQAIVGKVPVRELLASVYFVQLRAYSLRIYLASAHLTSENLSSLRGRSLLLFHCVLTHVQTSAIIHISHHEDLVGIRTCIPHELARIGPVGILDWRGVAGGDDFRLGRDGGDLVVVLL